MDENRPLWYGEDKRVNEVLFAEQYLTEHPMKCIGGRLFTVDGVIDDEDSVRNSIYREIRPYITNGTAKQVTALLAAVKLACYSEPLPLQQDRIHTANGTYFLTGSFTTDKEYCQNRLPVSYVPEASKPERWLRFLSELLYEEDIPTLQEYMGYLLIPSTRAQKMLVMIGRGGEGKSRIGSVLRALLGDGMNTCSILKVETNRFARADLEFRLLSLDDDIPLDGLPKTNILKSLVTLEGKIDTERKGIQSRQQVLYARFLCFGNGALTAKNDSSYAFFRRQLIIYVKERDDDRIDDPYLADKLKAEREGILLWAIEGLNRLIRNDYRFTVSERAQQKLKKEKLQADSVDIFLRSDNLMFSKDGETTTAALYERYSEWCADSFIMPEGSIQFAKRLFELKEKLGISFSKHIEGNQRGYKGVCLT